MTGYTGTAANFGTYTITLTGAAPAAPEPTSFLLLATGILGLLTVSTSGRRKRAGSRYVRRERIGLA